MMTHERLSVTLPACPPVDGSASEARPSGVWPESHPLGSQRSCSAAAVPFSTLSPLLCACVNPRRPCVHSISQVDKLFGPGNQFVTAAKMLLQNSEAMVAIDMPAGPSEARSI